MQIQTFKLFSDLAQTGSFSKAAEANGVTQSAVSQQIRAIEKRFDVKLIERGRRNFALTAEGKVFLDASREILGTIEGLGARIQSLQNVVSGELRIATIFSIGLHELPPYLKAFRRRYPDVEVRVEYCKSSEVYTAVLEHRADLGLVAYPGQRRGIRPLTFWRDRLVLICPPGHPLGPRKKVSLRQLDGEKFIAFAPDLPTRREIDRKLRAAGVRIKLAFEFDNIETVKRAVEIENAVSVVPETAIRAEVEAGTLATAHIDEPGMWRPLGALVRTPTRSLPALREFLAMLEQTDLGGESRPLGGKSR